MSAPGPDTSALRAAAVGLIGLAAAMGIGRFAFTPLLPLMQAEDGLSLAQGSYLASANYAGYLLGALIAFARNLQPAHSARLGLIGVAVATVAMAPAASFPVWLAMRAIAGVASAFVLIGISGWALAELARAGRAGWSGWVFAGVGSGILLTGLAVLAIAAAGETSSFGWLVLGIAATIAAAIGMGSITASPAPAGPAAPPAARAAIDRRAWLLVACYGSFGFGYIIPATFLPASARALIPDPAVFGWTWPVLGLAAALSTVLAAAVFRKVGPRRQWMVAQIIMSAGVALPALHNSVIALLISALAVGGTFMVITMAGLQEARRVGGAAAPRLMSAMTAAFASGQLLGPFTVAATGLAAEAIRVPSLIAGLLLALSAIILPFVKEATPPLESAASAMGKPG